MSFCVGLQVSEGLCREWVCFWFLSWLGFPGKLMQSQCGVLNFLHARITRELSEIPKHWPRPEGSNSFRVGLEHQEISCFWKDPSGKMHLGNLSCYCSLC